MSSDSAPPQKPLLKNPYLYTSSLAFVILLYVCWIFFSRWDQNREFRRKAQQERTERQRESDRAALQQFGGSELAIQYFYSSPGIIRRGESAQLCYSVANAKTVTLDPPVAAVWPSYTRCFDVSPSKTTTYKLTIAGASGQTLSSTATLKVE